LDELLRSVSGAQNAFINLEDLTKEDLAGLKSDMQNWLATRSESDVGWGSMSAEQLE
jgi:low affinity Fe/Cu permease